MTPSAAKSYSRPYWAMTYRPQDPSTIAPRGECGYGMYKVPVAAATSISTEANGAGDERSLRALGLLRENPNPNWRAPNLQRTTRTHHNGHYRRTARRLWDFVRDPLQAAPMVT